MEGAPAGAAPPSEAGMLRFRCLLGPCSAVCCVLHCVPQKTRSSPSFECELIWKQGYSTHMGAGWALVQGISILVRRWAHEDRRRNTPDGRGNARAVLVGQGAPGVTGTPDAGRPRRDSAPQASGAARLDRGLRLPAAVPRRQISVIFSHPRKLPQPLCTHTVAQSAQTCPRAGRIVRKPVTVLSGRGQEGPRPDPPGTCGRTWGSASVRQTNGNHRLIHAACDKPWGTRSSSHRIPLGTGTEARISPALPATVFNEACVEL